MSIGNIDSTIRNKTSKNTWIPIALLPIPPKWLEKLPDYSLEQQELDALQVFHEVVSHILSPLSDATTLKGVAMVCSDEKVRTCIPKLAVWLADHIENCNLHAIATNQYPVCIAPPDTFGEFPQSPFPPGRTPSMLQIIQGPTKPVFVTPASRISIMPCGMSPVFSRRS